MTRHLLAFAAVLEGFTGLALMLAPGLVGRLLLGAPPDGQGVVIARVAGIALLSLGISCLPVGTPLAGMLTYNLLATAYLTWLGISGEFAGALLWPVAALHAAITLFLIRGSISLPGNRAARTFRKSSKYS